MCSNTECRAVTCGPAQLPDRAVSIGEAAHIFGARRGAARYRDDMTDVSRAEITNGIWLCRNCHKLVDSDPPRFPSDLLFQWRNLHEQYVISKIGATNDRLQFELSASKVEHFASESALVRRIVRDSPNGWEYRLSAELLRDYLRPSMRAWKDLQLNLYTKPSITIADNPLDWFRARVDEAGRLVPIIARLYTQELPRTWGPPGQAGDAIEVRHVCKLIQGSNFYVGRRAFAPLQCPSHIRVYSGVCRERSARSWSNWHESRRAWMKWQIGLRRNPIPRARFISS